jgi:pimeloyl-ACP methyl ester carboxylesterase
MVLFLQGFSTSLGQGAESSALSVVRDDLSSLGFANADMRDFSYNGFSDTLTPRPYSCDDVGQPLSVSLDRLEEAVSITQRIWPGRKVVLVGHSYGGLVAMQALTRASADPNHAWLLDAVSGAASFDAPLYGSGQWRQFVAFLFSVGKVAIDGDLCKVPITTSAAASTIGDLRDDYDGTASRYRTLAAAAGQRNMHVATVGNRDDALYRPGQSLVGQQAKGVAVLSAIACVVGWIPGCLAAVGLHAGLADDLSETQVINVPGIAHWLKDLGPGSEFYDSHRIALRDPELRRWALQQAGLPVPSAQPLTTSPAISVQPTAVPTPRPSLAAAAPVQPATAPRMVSYTRTVRLPPNGSDSKFGVTIALKQGDPFGASFSEQQNGDIRLYVIAPDGSVTYGAGQVHGPFSTGTLYAPVTGNYVVWFDNGFSVFSGKTISLRVDYPQR